MNRDGGDATPDDMSDREPTRPARVLFCSHPGLSHFFLLVPLAWAFRSEGHEVIVAVADCSEVAAGSGLEVVDIAPDFDMDEVGAWVATNHPDAMELMATTPMIDPTDFAPGVAGVNRPLVPGTMDLVDDWQPDLVVYDQATTTGLLAAARGSVPAVQLTLGVYRTGGMHATIGHHLADLAAAYDVKVGDPDVAIETYPPSLLDGQPEGRFVRWVPYNGGSVASGRLGAASERHLAARPRLLVSMGTTELAGYGVGSLAAVLEAVAPIDADVVLAVGDADISELGDLPPNVRRIGWTPLSSLLRTCDAVVHPGGGGTVMHAVTANVPQLLAPDPANLMHHLTCEAVRRRGIGLAMHSDDVDTSVIETLLGDDSIRRATDEVRRENLTLPTPAETVRELARLVR